MSLRAGNIRKDGRTPNEVREINCTRESNARVDGAVRFSFGDVEVLGSATGPVEANLRDEIVDRCTIDVNFRSINNVTGVQYKELADQIEGALSSVVVGEQLPRSLVRFVVQTLSSPQTPTYMVKEAVSAPPFRIPISEKAAAINGAIMASLAANIPLSGVLLCVSLAVIDDVIVLDPSSYEEADATSVHLLGFTFSSTTNKALSISESLGNFNQETYIEIIKEGSKNAEIMYNYIKTLTI
ncbi:hypothetical protein WALSEDRAFT_69929 [Wallemia mellicola CBS 633.66]|uniref:Uncharacterized protein n=1 Tax=Wallemia mellicola (strain ATCC MYA-4683 / CBS 633.66) TaxID=671144 RepID=I4Y8T3_WALMC|nr:hypothetical protein WALSEDRAFT_69929 [Wallemia mellicola CBS 633.66]EIM20375.1 hypothetical protein WALSEDRAFT_69929 [Wallemia mellicola CBS 633.66]|eukprot:XP_006959632.1 hypothetical protein WALSEDRAFT_69929 [Wallemia mellicola CBS 633.66]